MPNTSQHLVGDLLPPQKRKRLDKMEDLEGVLRSGESARSSLERRLKAHVAIAESGCWEWTGCLMPNGYPQIAFRRKAHLAHRMSYALFVGPIQAGLFVLHKCDNPKCINPEHLKTGTQKDNIADAVSRGRHAVGVRQGKAKLTDSAVFTARKEYANGRRSLESLALDLGVSRSTIWKAIKGMKWKHVPFPVSDSAAISTVRSEGAIRGWNIRRLTPLSPQIKNDSPYFTRAKRPSPL